MICDRCGKDIDTTHGTDETCREIEVQWKPVGWENHDICTACYKSFEEWWVKGGGIIGKVKYEGDE